MKREEPSLFAKVIHQVAWRTERAWDRYVPTRTPRRLTVVPFLAHGSRERLVARGRVLANRPAMTAKEDEAVWTRMRRMAARFFSREVGGVSVEVGVGDVKGVDVTDHEGYYEVELAGYEIDSEALFHTLEVSLEADIEINIGVSRVMIPTSRATRAVISDIDDTVLVTGAARTAQMLFRTITGSEFTRSWFPGVAELYQGLNQGRDGVADNPFFYVSSSPWNLYDFLIGFIKRSALPLGPLFLRDLGVDESRFIDSGHHDHKVEAIEEILAMHDLPVVLMGDSGQRDPEIYRDVVLAHPERVEAVFLRHVVDERRARQVREMYAELDISYALGANTTSLAVIAEREGFIPPGWSERVALVTE